GLVPRGSGGEEGIRTLEKLLTSTPLAGERLRPLGHLSGASLDKENRRHNQPSAAVAGVEISSASSHHASRAALPCPVGTPASAWASAEGLRDGFSSTTRQESRSLVARCA